MNVRWSQQILEKLFAEGVRDIVFCPGARNSPLIAALARTEGFTTHSFFEERAASFFALGLARRTGKAAAVLTTSGTAAAELLPAVIEAHHTGVPLISVTADRPRRLRGTGAPQAIDQTGLFAKFVQLEFDLEGGEHFDLGKWNRRSPVHLNVCFDEPLIDHEPGEKSQKLVLAETDDEAMASFAGVSAFSNSAGPEWATLRLTRFLKQAGALVVVVGTLETADEREAVAAFLKDLGAPVYLEGTSGLRERADLEPIAIRSGDKLLAWALKRGLFSRVLRIGGIPTVRIWRDLDERESPIEVFSLSSIPFAGLSRGEFVCAPIAPALSQSNVASREPDSTAGAILLKDRAVATELRELFEREPLAEPSLVRALSRSIDSSSLVYVGNSLPIREWDLAASYEKTFAVEANRGVNGIDGQLSTFIGLAIPGVDNWAIVGDLTAMYDLTAPWALQSRRDLKLRIVVINNGGGRIFSRTFRDDLFENRHSIGFEHWAKMWGWGYRRWEKIPEEALENPAVVVELVPDEEASQRFWTTYDSFWS